MTTPSALPQIDAVAWPPGRSRLRSGRVLRVSAVAVRCLAPAAVRLPFCRDRDARSRLVGRAVRDMAVALGATFVKLAQLLASSPSLAGPHLADALRDVLDRGPAEPWDVVRRTVEEDLGRPLHEVFSFFDPTPIGAASLAVVHRATLIDGTDVAVKVQRPGSVETIAADLAVLRTVLGWLARQVPVATIPGLPGLVDALADQLAEELDFRNEARVMAWFSGMTAMIGASRVFAPSTVAGAIGPRVLTMEYIHGSTIDDLERIAEWGIDARRAIETLIEAWFALALCTGCFHGDMHAGNLLLTRDGRVALLDWGIAGRLPEPSRRFFRRSLEGALGDETAWADVRDHMLASVDMEALKAVGVGEAELLIMVRAQTLAIMTSPFRDLNLTMLMPTAPIADVEVASPTTLPGWLELIRSERRRLRAGDGSPAPVPPRGDMLLIKQLVFFERYGKLFLGDRPLIYDPDVYRALLDRPDLRPAEV